MAKYRFAAVVGVSAYTVVEAYTEDDARKIAEARGVAIGGSNSGFDEDEFWLIEDADGEPEGIHLAD